MSASVWQQAKIKLRFNTSHRLKSLNLHKKNKFKAHSMRCGLSPFEIRQLSMLPIGDPTSTFDVLELDFGIRDK